MELYSPTIVSSKPDWIEGNQDDRKLVNKGKLNVEIDAWDSIFQNLPWQHHLVGASKLKYFKLFGKTMRRNE